MFKRIILVTLAGVLILGNLVAAVWCQKPDFHMFTDMAGRKARIPVKVQKVFSTSQIGTITTYTINPKKLIGWNFALASEQKKFIPASFHKLPVLGAWSGKNNSANIEEIIRLHPDFILSMGDIDNTSISSANRIQEQLGIPVVLMDGSLQSLDKAYLSIGELMGETARAKILASDCRKTLDLINAWIKKIPMEKRCRIYYAEGSKGLETDPKGALHTEVLDFAGGFNVANVPSLKGYGRSSVSLEQIFWWDPDLILIGVDQEMNGKSFYDLIFKDPNWSNIKAVKNHSVYEIPSYPFNWFDRPPGVNRIIGVKWLANLIYPDLVRLDMRKEVKDFYQKYYFCKLTDNDAAVLLKRAAR